MKRRKGLRGTDRNKSSKARKSIRPGKIFIYALALAALGGGGYLLYSRARKKKSISNFSSDATDLISYETPVTDTTTSAASSTKAKASTRSKSNDDFPLKKGSRGTRVTVLQQALIKNGAAIKADGKFGPATLAALKAAGYSDSIDESSFANITGQAPSSLLIVFNPGELARKLFNAANLGKDQEVVSMLQQIKTVSEYSTVNEYYKKLSIVSKTIVTHLLDYAFKLDAAAQMLIKKEFTRIGLKVNDSGVWSLQGIQLYKDLMTIRQTIVIDAMNNRIPVSRNTILGDEVKIENGMTWFRSVDRSILRVPTQDVKYSTS
ncbi:peptidoglycan-binding domain-containing protein [Ohtaekwangia koreensis]|uniref:Predicted Peptidoglycan domain-containing protein n=1 Tax=Ohtaekwangia koreensis TaxID=688867 RepID=A0A1T5J737_9BACT|nr:putative peptidoglycan-binding domain-containing protein [Ohtaekwangia koreensis]SKC47209.1 Predicted Peptidoglycan domain-containing protein [Ohtaekwangia koreensis]